MPPYLEVISGDQTDMAPLEGIQLTVGRGKMNDIALKDPAASRRHAVFEKLAAGWSVSDIGSKNGTLVNGELVDQPRPLYSGDEIIVGETRLIYHSGDIH